jgi:hypothetical protein
MHWAWRYSGRRLRLLAAIVLPCLVAAGTQAADIQQRRCFRLFDATAYVGKPDLRARGFEPIQTFEPDRWWPEGETHDDLPSPLAARHWMADIRDKQGKLVLDLERWWIGGTDAPAAEAAMRRYLTIIEWLRGAGYAGQIGYYGVIPIWDRARSLQPEGSAARLAWHKENERAQPLADRVDILYPSLYTGDEDVQSWERFAVATLQEARQLARGKPVYPFLWPQYAPDSKALSLRYLSRAQWARELEVVGNNADGAVIWGGIGQSKRDGPPRWDESADWWQATLAFLSRRGACVNPAPEPPDHVKVGKTTAP